ncbi:SDR family oxidoreductase [Solirubrobacter sp. CPCC 204708]|uniref:SDR family oxidoreductase n=1 Tax=Solirubrobacter deserti TaxID=2282478 RepID=A0ABT4RL45_9ACTN|nr:SDR family oxidoreductase [Solirubrobacter deserti]MBE2318996.1 SDR family oxidoreductase [Solirubrobacter deserti]MDA0139279.1 SDR family oxidoreductase [Solirubrobacter deserti]
MDVLIAGGHGQIARRLIRILARNGHTARGLIRNPDHVADLEADGGHPVLCDLEHDDLRPHIGGAEAIVFAAGAGPGSGPERKQTVDLGAAVKCIEAAQALGVDRFVIVSSIGTQDAEHAGPMRAYLEAKAAADDALRTSGLSWTIVKPGMLTDEPGSGTVDIATAFGRRDAVSRDNVALVLYHVLLADNTIRTEFELFDGPTPADVAVQSLQRGDGPVTVL